MRKEDKGVQPNRRNFLKLAAASAPAMAATAVIGTEAVADEAPVNTGGLQMTDHVKKYLETARF
jgi:hypothetical protein